MYVLFFLNFVIHSIGSDATAVKNGLIKKGYRVGYANIKTHTSNGLSNAAIVSNSVNAVDAHEARASSVKIENGSEVGIAYVCDYESIYIRPFNVEYRKWLFIFLSLKILITASQNMH